jgi:hypothetical protein
MIATNQAGVLGGKIFFLSLQNGGLDIVYSDQIEIPESVKAAADAAFQGIADDTIALP